MTAPVGGTLADITAAAEAKARAGAKAEALNDIQVTLRAKWDLPDAEPIPLAAILDAIQAALRMYVHFTSAEAVWATTLWIAHTHVIDRLDRSPRLAIRAATRQSGKTRLLEVMGELVARPWPVIEPSPAVLYRKIEAQHPTVLLDEADRLFSRRAEDQADIVGIINAGNIRGATVPRVIGVGTKQTVHDFDAYSAFALAGIAANWPDTIMDRSIVITLERKTAQEPVARFRQRETPLLRELRAELERALADVPAEDLEYARDMAALSDRAVDNWEPLLAIARLADELYGAGTGTTWSRMARQAARVLSKGHAALMADDDRDEVQLLNDVMEAFGEETFVGSKDLVEHLTALDARPWADWPHGFTTHKLAKLLRRLDIRPTAPFGSAKRGYDRAAVRRVWERIGTRTPTGSPTV